MIKIVSNTIEKISYLVIFIISLILLVYFLLLNGIKIDNLILPYANIKKLYIKLDKKLIVKADYLKIKKNYKKSDTKSQLLSIKNYLKYFYHFFKELDIKKIEYKDQIVRLRYIYNRFFLDTNELYFLASISLSNKADIKMDIKNLYLKRFYTYFKGKLDINLIKNLINFDGSFSMHGLKGFAKLTLDKDILYYYIYNTTAKSIAPLMNYLKTEIKIDKEISNWIYRYIIAKQYRLHYMYGKIDIKTKNFYPKLIKAEGSMSDVDIRFHKKLKTIYAKKVQIALKNGTLFFKLLEPTFEDIKLNGSKVSITNLFSKSRAIDIVLKILHPLDSNIKNILKTYKINTPFYQKNSNTDSLVQLHISLVPYSLHIKGNFYTTNSDIYFKDIKFHTKKAKISLDNNIIIIDNTNISYKKLFDINTSGIFDINKSIYKGSLDINRAILRYKDELIFDANQTKSSIVIDFKENRIDLNDLNATLFFGKRDRFIFNSLKKIYNTSPLLKKYGIKDKKAILTTQDFKSYFIRANIFYDNKVLLYHNKPLKRFDANITIDSNSTKIEVDRGIISANISNDIKIDTNSISYDLRNRLNNQKAKDIHLKKPITLNAINATIYLTKELIIPTDRFTLFINHDKRIFSSTYGKNHIFYSKDKKIVDIHTNYLSADYINTIIHHKLFKKGKFQLFIKESNGSFWGNCKILNSEIKSPKKGGDNFKIDTGEFNFRLKDGMLVVKDIVLKNRFSTLKGSGYIDLKNKNMHLSFKVNILKDLGKTIKAIPLIGYILLGKDGKFSSKVTISGDINDPQIETDFSKDVIKSPLNIIFRVIKLPFKLLLPKNSL